MRTWLAVGVLGLTGCALTDKAPPVEIRYFSPERYGEATASGQKVQQAVSLRLGRITSSAHLRARIAYRTSEFELGTYDTLRWTENPEEFLRRTLERALFEQRPLSRVDTAGAPTLDIELVLFDELRSGETRSGEIAIRYALWADRRVLATGVIALQKPADKPGIIGVVGALGAALDEASSLLAELVADRLSRPVPDG